MRLLPLLLWFAAEIGYAAPPLVFIHGIKGGKLIDKSGSVVWISAWQALGLSTPNLALPLSFEQGGQVRDGQSAGEVLDWVTVVPLLYRSAVYGPWLEAAAKLGSFHPFAYDWRRDNRETVEAFTEFLRKLPEPARVVAHSMGGLITLAVLNRNPELFHSVVFAGVPFAGGIGFLLDLHAGTSVGLNGKILSPLVLASFPSVYTLFPEKSEALVEAGGKVLTMDFYDAGQWRDKKLGQFAEGRATPDTFAAFLAEALARGKEFRSWLTPRAGKYPPVLVVNGKSFPTLAKAVAGGSKAVAGWDFESAPKEPGDGRVLEAHSLPPAGIPFEVFSSSMEHSDLLNDPAVVERIRALP